jgi:hypothetical protein
LQVVHHPGAFGTEQEVPVYKFSGDFVQLSVGVSGELHVGRMFKLGGLFRAQPRAEMFDGRARPLFFAYKLPARPARSQVRVRLYQLQRRKRTQAVAFDFPGRHVFRHTRSHRLKGLNLPPYYRRRNICPADLVSGSGLESFHPPRETFARALA